MEQRVKAYIQKYQMIERGELVVAGISGGADSVCMFRILTELRKELGFELIAVHVNHGIRGETALRDQHYVEKLCKEAGVKLRIFQENIPEYAGTEKLSEEEAGRNRRREVFEQVLCEEHADKIALAHHEDDNAETVLMHLCRGTGLRGICGIAPKEGPYIRPLLCLGRNQIRQYLEQNQIPFCEDETNLEDRYTRNRVRHVIMPALETQLNAKASSHISDTASRMRSLLDYAMAQTERYVQLCRTTKDGEIRIGAETFSRVPEALQGEVLLQILAEAAGRRKDLGEVHVQTLRMLFEKQTGRKADLPYGLEAVRSYDGITITKKAGEPETESREEHLRWEDGRILDTKGREIFRYRIFPNTPDVGTFPKSNYTKWFDYDIIKDDCEFRHRRSGDFLRIDREGRSQKLKQYFINEKIPSPVRDRIWLFAEGSEIIWVVGHRQNPGYQITEKTARILEICYMEEE